MALFFPEVQEQEIKTEVEEMKVEDDNALSNMISGDLFPMTETNERILGNSEQVNLNPFLDNLKEENDIKIEEEDLPSLEYSSVSNQQELSQKKDPYKASLNKNQVTTNPKILKISKRSLLNGGDGSRSLKIMKVGVGSSIIQDGDRITTMMPSKVFLVATDFIGDSKENGKHDTTLRRGSSSSSGGGGGGNIQSDALRRSIHQQDKVVHLATLNKTKNVPVIKINTNNKDSINANPITQEINKKAASVIKISTAKNIVNATAAAKSTTHDKRTKKASVAEMSSTKEDCVDGHVYSSDTNYPKSQDSSSDYLDNFEKIYALKIKQIEMKRNILEQQKKLRELELENLMKMEKVTDTMNKLYCDLASTVDSFL